MPTSGITNWELTLQQAIERAYAKLGIPGEGNSLSVTQLADGATAFNMAIQLAITEGMPLWKRTVQDETPSVTSQTYTIADASKITAVYIEDTGGTQYELKHKSLYDFMRLPTDAIGVPVHWTFAQAIQGYAVSFWPLTSDAATVSEKTLHIIYQKEIENANGSSLSDTFDFPAYWLTALVYRAAVLLAPEHGVPLQDRGMLIKETDAYWDQAKGYDDEDGSLYIQPSPWMRNFRQ